MPNKRNGIYRGKPKLDLHGLYSGDGQSYGLGSNSKDTMASGPRQQGNEKVKILHDVFPNVDAEIIRVVLEEYNGNLEECTEKLQEISGEISRHKMEEKTKTDLAIIACSLLADESQPVGASTLDIYDSAEDFSNDLGCCPFSDTVHHDHENAELSNWNVSSSSDVHKSSTSVSSRKYLTLSSDYERDESSNVYVNESMNGDRELPELNKDDPYNFCINKNNKKLMRKHDIINSLTDSSDLFKEKEDNISSFLNYCYHFATPTNNIGLSPDNLNSGGLKTDVDNDGIFSSCDKQISDKCNSTTAGIVVNRNSELCVIENTKSENPSNLLTTYLNQVKSLCINQSSKISQEWDTFYSSLESDGFNYNADCESMKHVGQDEQCTLEAPSAVMDSHQHDTSIASSEQKISDAVVENTSPFRTRFSHKNDAIKAYPHVDTNSAFQKSETVSSSVPANKPKCSLQTSAISISQSNNSGYSSFSKDECKDIKKSNPSVKLSPSALEFIPRSLAKLQSKPLAQNKTAQVTTASRNQTSNLIEVLKPSISPGKNMKSKAKKCEGNTKVDSICPAPQNDSDEFLQPLRSGSLTSSSKDPLHNMIFASAEAQTVTDPTDPLGWNSIFPINTSSLLDTKSQRSTKARKTSIDKSSQQIATSSAFCPWQSFDVSGGCTLSAVRVSSPKVKSQTSVERSKTSFNSGASSLSSLHDIAEYESKVSDSGSINTNEPISRTLKLSDSPIATRLSQSQISNAPSATVTTKVNCFHQNLLNIPPTVLSTKNVDLTLETKPQNLHSAPAQPQLIKNKLQLQGVRTPMGIIRRYILEKQPVLIVLRGLPGSGKSYLAKQLITESHRMGVHGVILSTDDYFMVTGEYCFNAICLPDAHDWNKSRALQYMKESRSPIIIDNTNTTLWELLPYCVLALEHSYDVQIFEPDTSWKMKVAELARKNVHGVRKENIRKMKDRWESFSLDDVLRQTSHSIAARKTHTVLPGIITTTTAPASPSRQQNLQVDKQMTNLEQVHVTEINHQKSSSGNVPPACQDLGLSNWFDAQSQPNHLKIKKQKKKLATPSDKSPKFEITQGFLNLSLKTAIVNILKMPPSQAVDSQTNNDVSQTVSLSKRKLSNNPVKEEIIIKERHLSDESWDSESETPTADKDLEITDKLTQQFHIGDGRPRVQNEEVPVDTSKVSSKLLLELRQSEALDESSVLNNSCSTSSSYHTLASSSDVSSYHTVDDDDDEVLTADMLADDHLEDIQLFNQNTHLLLQESHLQHGNFKDVNPKETDAELLPVYFKGMDLPSDGDQPLRQHDSVKSDTYLENQGVEYESTIKNNGTDPSKRSGVKQTRSYSTEPSSALKKISTPMAASLEDSDIRKNVAEDSFTHKIRSACVPPNTSYPSSLVEYSDSDDSDKELSLSQNGHVLVPEELSEVQFNGPNAHEENVLDNKGDQVEAANCSQNVQEAARTYVREVSIDRSTQSSEESMFSGRERSPQIDSQVITPDLQHKKKKKRVRKGRNIAPFIEDSLKAKSKTQNWSSFVVPSSGSSNSSGDSVVLENPRIDTSSSTTQTDPYNFSIVHKLNSPAFNSLQPGEWTLSGIEVITSSSQSTVDKRRVSISNGNDTVVLRKIGGTVDQSTITDETVEKEEVDLETLQSCFPEYSRKQLETTMAICHNDLEWVTSHLLDSPALYDMEDDEEEGLRVNLLKPEKDSVPPESSKRVVKSLADMCTILVRNTNNVDADDLEMQMIQVGEDRLQKIEMFGRSRLHSLSQEDLGNQDYWPDDFVLDDFPLPWALQNFPVRQPSLIQSRPSLFRTSHFDSESVSQNCDFLSTLMKEKEFTSAPSIQEKEEKNYSSMSKCNDSSSSPSEAPHGATSTTEVTGEVGHPAKVQSRLIMPLDFVKNLESLYGPLQLQVADKGLVLDDGTARKIYNCLKLLATKNVLKNPNEQQLRNDEALARALQDEENSRTPSNAKRLTVPAGQRQVADSHATVPGWTNEYPSWMTQGKDKVNSLNGSVNISVESTIVRLHSVADTLHQLRGTHRSNVRAHKFQKKMPGTDKSVWYKARWRGQADSLVSIMEEEMAREEQQREQLRVIESTGDMGALATRIKRIELSNLFPSMSPDVLEDIFRSTGFSKEETIRVLQDSYNIPPAPISKDKEDILNRLRKSQQDFHDVEDFYDEDIPNKDSGMTYSTLRNEAAFCHQLATDCQQQALRYHSSGMQGAALFYRQRAKKYKENERTANFKAAQVLFDKGSERLQVENILDLHFYHLDEAINAVNVAIEIKEDEYRKKPDKKNSYLDIVTGWGRNSKDGKPKLKPAIISHLWARCYQFEERSPGMLRVYIGKKLIA